MSDLVILLVPGSFGLPEFYEDNMIRGVKEKGYDIRGLHMPTVGLAARESRPGPPPSMYDDAAFIAAEVEKIGDQGKDVIVIGHSYGGVPVSQSVKGVTKEEREKQGKKGGLVRIAYMTCLVPEEGKAAKDVLAEVPKGQEVPLTIGEDGWMVHDHPAETARVCLNHASPEEGTALIKKFPKHSAVSFINELTYPGYKDVPVSYLVCEDDLCIPVNVQEDGIKMIEKESGRKVDVTRIHGDHIPNFTKPQAVVDWVVSVAEKTNSSM